MIRQKLIAYAVRCIGLALCLSVVAAPATGQTEAAKPQEQQTAKQLRVFKEFADLVQQYVDLHRKLEASLPALGPKEPQEKIVERQKALSGRIKEARAAAKRGDIFAPEIAEEFRHLIRQELQGPKGSNSRKTIRDGEPIKPRRLRVNDLYPEALPTTTMPPSLLLNLPQLPKEVEYRIVGRDWVLLDIEANLIVDFIHEALPK